MLPPFKMVLSTRMEKYRHDTFWTKEPETIAWIKSFKNGETFCDVGANIGVYSLYAASLYPDSMIYAIEPDIANYSRLMLNIALNRFKNIACFNLCLGNAVGMERFYVQNPETGSSGGQLARPVNEHGRRFKPRDSYLLPVMSLGWFMTSFRLPAPAHIKIDVDGHEADIIEGILPMLLHNPVRSILAEFNHRNQSQKTALEKLGFTTANRFNRMKNHSRVRRAREGIKAENVIFTRSK